MLHFIDLLFAAPTLPGTVLLGVCLAYWLLLIAGAVHLDLLHIDWMWMPTPPPMSATAVGEWSRSSFSTSTKSRS
jgi:hypothetical protein